MKLSAHSSRTGVGLTALLLLLCSLPGLQAAPLPQQEGFPAELIITDSPALAEQAEALYQMTQWLAEHMPRPTFMDKVKGFFGGGDRTPLVSLPLLSLNRDRIQGHVVAVQGLLEITDPGNRGLLHSEEATCLLTFAPGMSREGLPDQMAGLPVRAEGVAEVLPNGVVTIRVQRLQPGGSLAYIRLGRVYEMMDQLLHAVSAYRNGATLALQENNLIGAFAATRAAALVARPPRPGQPGPGPLVIDNEQRKQARQLYQNAWNMYTRRVGGEPLYHTWEQSAEGLWQKLPVGAAIADDLRELEKESFWYSLVQAFVTISAGNAGIGLLLLAVITRILVYPLTKKQLSSAREMQALQPEMKRLQQKFKDDKQKFQEEFWALCKERGVNPLGGCLPLLVQMPLLYFVYMGIRAYIVNLDAQSFLWVPSLAQPDMPLLVLYTVSQIAFGKLMQAQNPAAALDPQQRQQQQMMTYMMPLMFFFLFQSFPAGFMLYWLGTNLAYIAQQVWFNRTHPLPATAGATAGGAASPAAPSSGPLARQSRGKQSAAAGKEPATAQSYEQKKAAAEGKLTSKQQAEKRRKKRRWVRR